MNRILIVDDVATNRELIREALMRQEYKITGAVAGSQALEMMENEGADLVITDLRMPGISGVDHAYPASRCSCCCSDQSESEANGARSQIP